MPTLFDPIDVGVIANRICRAALPKIYRQYGGGPSRCYSQGAEGYMDYAAAA